ncbi:helix-turn-helix transcriptional regulator [Streptomyces sp. NPDC005012]|uniref:helix-turn-helix domain-containing protein n=1 Tax=Streptomyces sp. NPDC005012 TaxID=3154558 RepID=UPI0033B4C57B
MTGSRPERDEAVRRLANALRGLQQKSGCTLRGLETRVRISDSSLSRYFRGESVPVWPVVRDLCRAMGADPAEYRALWEAADRARQGDENEDRTLAAAAPQARDQAWWRRPTGGLSRAGVVAVAMAAAVAGGVLTWVAAVLLLQPAGVAGAGGRSAEGRAGGEGDVGVVVHNAEKACRKPRTHDCALALAYDPYRPYVRSNAAGRVWHHDLLQAHCTVADGISVTDENGKHSTIWIQVTHHRDQVWLPGIRVTPDDLDQLARLLPHCAP